MSNENGSASRPKISWKTLKYKHRRKALDLFAVLNPDDQGHVDLDNLDAAELSQAEANLTALVMSLVLDWSFIDEDTGERVPVGIPDELTDDQYFAVMDEFNAIMDRAEVKKTNVSRSSSGPKGFDQAKPTKRARKTG
ncbi:MAG TPA: hypothetical protein VGD99_21835 [Anaerolineae bacterium]|jgi:hypothetical protein